MRRRGWWWSRAAVAVAFAAAFAFAVASSSAVGAAAMAVAVTVGANIARAVSPRRWTLRAAVAIHVLFEIEVVAVLEAATWP